MVTFQLILNVQQLEFLKMVQFTHTYCHKISKINKMSNFFDDFFAPKTVFWKNHYWGGSEIDCFEPIFGFLMQFCFQKHRSGTWDPKDMFSAPSGHSATTVLCTGTLLMHFVTKQKVWSIILEIWAIGPRRNLFYQEKA